MCMSCTHACPGSCLEVLSSEQVQGMEPTTQVSFVGPKDHVRHLGILFFPMCPYTPNIHRLPEQPATEGQRQAS